jgi:hypothetical protein
MICGPEAAIAERRGMRRKNAAAILLAIFGVVLSGAPSEAGRRGQTPENDADVSGPSLEYYGDCVNEAKDNFRVDKLDRHVLYRCHNEEAVAYFNFLGRSGVRDEKETQPTGVFIFRTIRGKGRCWNMIADQLGEPMSVYGCFIIEDI